MKILKLNYLFILFSLLILFSCASDDDSVSEIEDTIRQENLKELGLSASDLLSEATYKSLTVELMYSSGYRPTQQTLDDFRIFLEERVNKPNGIIFIETIIDRPPGGSYTISEIKDIEAEKRTQYTEGNDIAVFIYFTHAKASTDTQSSVTLGTAYYNTSIVIYQQTLNDVSTSQNSDLYILEETTLQHEFGHLFGLVNILADDIHSDHEDNAHLKHCIIQDCLMYYKSNTRSYFRNRLSVPIFDPLCIEDLQAKGGK
ncbi:MAG: membrane metalloprotease [Flavobacterium sp.]|nr:MAG: membrane metalloprotease [Flavobacterium sp.]